LAAIDRSSSRLYLLLKSALFAAVMIYVGMELAERLDAEALASVQLGWHFVLAGGLCAWLSLALAAPLYREAQLLFEPTAKWLPATLVAWISPLGKYVPGKIGGLLGAVWIYRRFGVRAPLAASVLLVGTGSALSASFVILMPLVLVGDDSLMGGGSTLAWVLVAAGALFSHPRLFLIPLNRLLRRIGRQELILLVPFSRYLRLILLGVGRLAITGCAFWLIVNAVTEVAVYDWYRLTAAYTVAGVIGMLAFFAPGGLGVREGLLLLFLEPTIGGPELALAVIIMRICIILAEIVLALAGVVLWRRKTPTAATTS
jgi:uncharacterized membrane protein YbhN (UPF0104 family)